MSTNRIDSSTVCGGCGKEAQDGMMWRKTTMFLADGQRFIAVCGDCHDKPEAIRQAILTLAQDELGVPPEGVEFYDPRTNVNAMGMG